MRFELITILGPTATGKTKLAAHLANQLNGEIISADSRQVYKLMDIGTGKDLTDYVIGSNTVPFHLINVAEPTGEYNVYNFQIDFYKEFEKIKNNEKIPFLAGGSGLYLSSILQNYKLRQADNSEEKINKLNSLSEEELRKILLSLKPKQHNTTDLIDKERIIKAILIEETDNKNISKAYGAISSLNIGIKFERSEINKRITKRLKKRFDEGMIEEVSNLLNMGITHDKLAFFGLEYKYISLYLLGELNFNDMFQKLNSAIHKFAKRQMTWFRKMEREGVNINWFNGNDYNRILALIEKNFVTDAKPTG
ncbi:MAG: tRNA (adenosine(37)-N6)-dimethylallyltransferase MiaA [Ignavibacteria bacterium]|nr:tRNA (adenosine(37)-N6)-dimethylallyltransferase MiaA [Ignavibacteria bacterium]